MCFGGRSCIYLYVRLGNQRYMYWNKKVSAFRETMIVSQLDYYVTNYTQAIVSLSVVLVYYFVYFPGTKITQ